LRKEGEKGSTSRAKKEAEEGEEENRGQADGGKRGEAVELLADPSSVSVEANDAKTGVHCPQLRARKERPKEGMREKEKENDCLARV